MRVFKKNQQSGVAALEASITLPIFIILMFFAFELLKVNMVKNAVEEIAFEAGLRFIATGVIDDFDAAIRRHIPPGVARDSISYYFAMYDTLDNMCSVSPYGNEEVYWPEQETFSTAQNTYVDSDSNSAFTARNTSSSGYISLTNQHNPTTTEALNDAAKLTNKVFVLTVVCDYKFSSAMLEKLFAGGSNTKVYENSGASRRAKKFLIYGKMVGITDCNRNNS